MHPKQKNNVAQKKTASEIINDASKEVTNKTQNTMEENQKSSEQNQDQTPSQTTPSAKVVENTKVPADKLAATKPPYSSVESEEDKKKAEEKGGK